MIANKIYHNQIWKIYSLMSCFKNIKNKPWNHMLRRMEIVYHGVLLQVVNICFFIYKEIKIDLYVCNATKSTAWTVEFNGIRIWVAKSIRYIILLLNQTNSLYNLLKAISLNNALNVNFGFKKTRGAIIWHANANFSFVINVEGSIENVSVFKSRDSNTKKGIDTF